MRPLLIVYGKAPLPGRVKTRLCPLLTPEQAARAHIAFVADTIETLQGFAWCADIELQTTEETSAWDWLQVRRSLQPSGDLGKRLLESLRGAFASGRTRVAIFGSDSPTLSRAHVQVLLDSPADVAFGPSEDGGFYAIACRRMHPDMFAGVRWSTPNALEDAFQGAQRCGLSVALAARWFDVDTAADLERLNGYLAPRHTRLLLKELGQIRRKRKALIMREAIGEGHPIPVDRRSDGQ